ncbi:MAG TPA: GntR family transcriptional regulator [Croceicoccus sp.]|nr:GntR family transcriptional regulator [Croceicoccus sp.]
MASNNSLIDDRATAGARPKARITQASAIRQAIENDILSGVLKPGSPIDEEELAARFNVSRTPIREAMLQLQQGGLIDKQPRRHPTVVKLDLPRLVHMYEAVSELEALCARYAATRINSRERDELQEVHRLAGEALAAGDATEYARFGRHFHSIIMQATHNSVLVETVNKLALHTLAYRRFQLTRPGHSEQNQAFHEEILAAILAGNGDRASDAMRRHVTLSGDVLADYISMGESALSDMRE